MKTKIVLLFLISLLAGCVSTSTEVSFSQENPGAFYASRWNGGAIQIDGRILSESRYQITAKGAGSCSEEQIMEEWIFVADFLAAGREYTSQTKTKEYRYQTSAGLFMYNHDALMIYGTIEILDPETSNK